LWALETAGQVDSSPAVTGDKVVVGSDDGRVYLVRLEDGKQLWSYEIGEPVGTSPAVVDNRFVVGSEDGRVYAFGAR
jgi:outer membrane protein assembly factor BamB